MTAVILTSLMCYCGGADPAPAKQSVIVVVGHAGNDEFREQFEQWAAHWRHAAENADAKLLNVGGSTGGSDDRELLKQILSDEMSASEETLWIVFIGHGTFDGNTAKFNLRGPDVTAKDLSTWLKPCKRPLALINCASSSGPFINSLSGPNRVVVTSTKSGYQYNFARFGNFFSESINDLSADLDKDEQVSILEAFLLASARVAEFYEQEGRLATEHALIDDNGDNLGTEADWFRGVRAVRVAKKGAEPDGLRANQYHLLRNPREQHMPVQIRQRRDQLERDLDRLRRNKTNLSEQDYYQQLEAILVELARLYEQLESPQAEADTKTSALYNLVPMAKPDSIGGIIPPTEYGSFSSSTFSQLLIWTHPLQIRATRLSEPGGRGRIGRVSLAPIRSDRLNLMDMC